MLWVLKHTQSIVTSLTAIAVLHLRTPHVVYFVGGALITSFTAKLMKRFIRQPRPSKFGKKSMGMPSTHSATITFMGVYLSLCALYLPLHPALSPSSLVSHFSPESTGGSARVRPPTFRAPPPPDDFMRLPPNRLPPHSLLVDEETRLPLPARILLAAAPFTFSLLVCWSRVRLGVHTRKQVLAGMALGGAIALWWWLAWESGPPGARWMWDEAERQSVGWKDGLGAQRLGALIRDVETEVVGRYRRFSAL